MEDVRPLTAAVVEARAPTRIILTLTAIFGALALGLALVGLYGVVSYAVRRRTRELGIRLALGAAGGRIRRSAGTRARSGGCGDPAGTGGLAAAHARPRDVLVEVSRNDPLTLAAAALLFAAACWLACLVPATRALRVSPVRVLRGE